MKTSKITKTFISFMLVLGLAGSSFAMGQGGKKSDKGFYNGKVKVEQKYRKKDVKIVKDSKKHDHKKDVTIVKVYNNNHRKHYSKKKIAHCYNGDSNLAAKCLGTGLCLLMLAAVNS